MPDDEKELLPLKIDGSLIRRIEKLDSTEIKTEIESENEEDEIEAEKGRKILDFRLLKFSNLDPLEEDLSQLSPIDRLVREKELLAEVEKRIHSQVKALQLDPHNEVCLHFFNYYNQKF